jgi:glycosyltransferase involved in cell wall biosynthesis
MLTEGFPRKPAVWILGSFPPRRCGIATFTNDLADAIEANGTRCRVAAVHDGSDVEYANRVELKLDQDDLASYIEAAEEMNRSNASAVLVQHEFGIFGGEAGAHLVTLLRFLKLPVVTTLHTVLDQPCQTQRWVMEEILSRSERVVVMSRRAKSILRRTYGRDENVHVIPHGVPPVLPIGRTSAKRELGWEGREVILTFGLLSPDKGIETMLEAMGRVAEDHPDSLYVVAGQTHPHIVRSQGEAYRESLERKVEDAGLQGHVLFVNRFTELDELCAMLTACDLYVTPYLKMEQITSGTLSYAVGMGRCVVSTPYWHAEEILANGPGQLVATRDVEGFAEAVSGLLADDEKRHLLEAQAWKLGQMMRWPRVGAQYLRLIAAIWRPIDLPGLSTPVGDGRLSLESADSPMLPPTRHLAALTDDTGLLQHAFHDVANRHEGYCTDDNARALEVLCALPSSAFEPGELSRLERVYLSFLYAAWNPDRGVFRNFLSFDRTWLDEFGSADCQGRALRALATGARLASSDSRRELCQKMFQEAWLPQMPGLDYPRFEAQALLAACEWLRHRPDSDDVRAGAERLAGRLLSRFEAEADDGWRWFESELTYDNGVLPHALLEWGRLSGDDRCVRVGLESLAWLVRHQHVDGYFAPIGNQGFWQKGAKRPQFGQQPLEAWATVGACEAAHAVDPSGEWLQEAQLALNWFYGTNALGALLVDLETGACADGLEENGPNSNRGAESCLAYLATATLLERLSREAAHPRKAALL